MKRLFLLAVLACSLVGCGGSQEETPPDEPTETTGPEKTDEETTTVRTFEETMMREATVEEAAVEEIPAPLPEESAQTAQAPVEPPVEPPVELAPPSDITPEQAENRRILAERQATYDGTGPSPWVQGQIDWAREQGLIPADPGADHAAQSREANNGQGEGANMCGIAPDATWYGQPC